MRPRTALSFYLLFALSLSPLAIAQEYDFPDEGTEQAPSTSSSDGSNSTESPPQKQPWLVQKPSGVIRNTFTSYLQPFSDTPGFQERLDFELESSASNGTYGAKLIPWTYFRVPNAIGGKKQNMKLFFEMKEGWVERASENWDLRIGNQLITWGAADQINPTDIWNPSDMYDLLQPQKLPMPTIRGTIHPSKYSDYSAEILLTPLFRESKLPLYIPDSGTADVKKPESRWYLPMPSRVATTGFAAPLRFKVAEATYPKTWQAGARIKAMRLGGWDFSASYFNGVEKLPRVTFNTKGDANDPSLPIILTILPSYHRTQMFGVDGAGSIDTESTTYGIRFETAFFLPDNSRATGIDPQYEKDLTLQPYLFSVLGVDHTFEKKVLKTVLYMNAMLIFRERFGGQSSGQNLIEGLPNTTPFDRNLVLYVESRINPLWTFSTAMVGSFENIDGMIAPSLKHQFTDNLKTSLSADFFLGRDSGFYGQFKDNRRVHLSGTYSF